MEDQIYESLIRGVRKPKHKKAIFMCGAAGVGKTTTQSKFLKDAGIGTTYVTLNIDNIRPLVGSQDKATAMFPKLIDRTIEDGYSFLYDGTCRNKGQILRRMNLLKQRGYEIILGIVYAPMSVALRRLKDRVNQPLDPKIAKEIYIHVQNSIETFMKSDIPDKVYLYNNTEQSQLIYHKNSQKVYCDIPNSKFYFDVC